MKSLISRASVQWTGTFLVLLVPWALLVVHLSTFWSVDGRYSYGYVVPILAAFFFWEKWKTLPEGAPDVGNLLPLIGACIAVILLALIWLAHEAVPDWSVINWAFALSVILYTLSLVTYWCGGSATFHLLFPILFILTAIPWPQRFELALVQGFMKWVASAAAELNNWLGVPALASGNTIWLPTGLIGVDEACSGVRSLQSTLMVSLFLGELFRIRIFSRFVLIGIGLIFALFFNLVRAATLVYLAYAQGFLAMGKWHDLVGHGALGISLLLLGLVAGVLRQPVVPDPKDKNSVHLKPVPMPLILGLSSWILFFILGTEIWYRSHETDPPDTRRLSVVWPGDVSGISKVSIPDSARRILLYDDAQCASWFDRNGVGWTFYSFVWNSGRTSTQSARIHRPDTCLPAAGVTLRKKLIPTIVDIGGTPLAFQTYLFDRNGTTLHVFYLIWEKGNRDVDPTALSQDWSGLSRLQRVWFGQRNLGQQSFEIVLSGAISDEEAKTTLQAELGKIVQIQS
jgi:exosortase